MAVEETIQTVRESPEIEAYRIGLLKSAKELADQPITLPTQQVAGLTGLQEAARTQAETGLGAFLPYLTAGGQTLGQAGQTLGGVESALRAGAGPVTQELLDTYMNPYQQAVADEINRAYDLQLSGTRAGAVGSGAFGGSRAQIAESEIDRNRASALAQAISATRWTRRWVAARSGYWRLSRLFLCTGKFSRRSCFTRRFGAR